MGERCKLPQWGLGEAPAAEQFGRYLSQKEFCLKQFFVDFRNSNNNFLHKNKKGAWYHQVNGITLKNTPINSG